MRLSIVVMSYVGGRLLKYRAILANDARPGRQYRLNDFGLPVSMKRRGRASQGMAARSHRAYIVDRGIIVGGALVLRRAAKAILLWPGGPSLRAGDIVTHYLQRAPAVLPSETCRRNFARGLPGTSRDLSARVEGERAETVMAHAR